jgi:hypothetical protein
MSSPREMYEAGIKDIRTKLDDLSGPRDAELRKLRKEREALIPSSEYAKTLKSLKKSLKIEMEKSGCEDLKRKLSRQIYTITEKAQATKTPEAKKEAEKNDVEIKKRIEPIDARIKTLETDPVYKAVYDEYIRLSTELMQPMFKRAKK